MEKPLSSVVVRPSFPLEFQAEASVPQGTGGTWQAVSSGRALTCAVPAEFGGSGAGLSPEDLFGQALVNCFLGSMKVYAQASQVRFREMTAKAILTLDKNENGQPVMQSCRLEVRVTGADRPDRIDLLARKALKTGFILNSVRTEISLSLHVEDGAA